MPERDEANARVALMRRINSLEERFEELLSEIRFVLDEVRRGRNAPLYPPVAPPVPNSPGV